MNATDILNAAAPHARRAVELVAVIRAGHNLPWCAEEVKALRRAAKIEGDRAHAAEFNALHAILNVSRAMPRGETGEQTEAALACARQRVEMMRAALFAPCERARKGAP